MLQREDEDSLLSERTGYYGNRRKTSSFSYSLFSVFASHTDACVGVALTSQTAVCAVCVFCFSIFHSLLVDESFALPSCSCTQLLLHTMTGLLPVVAMAKKMNKMRYNFLFHVSMGNMVCG